MPREFEAKVLDVDPIVVGERIVARGGTHVNGPLLMRRYVYQIDHDTMPTWLRLRTNGRSATIAIKQILHDGIGGTDEIEVVVSDFASMVELLGKIGLTPTSYQENRRTTYELDTATLQIDEWPLLRPYLEIECGTYEGVVRAAMMLGYNDSQLTATNTIGLYAAHGIDLLAIPKLTFDVPQF